MTNIENIFITFNIITQNHVDMKLKELLFMLAIVFGFQVQQVMTATTATANGIEPVIAEEFTSAADADYAKVIKKEKKGLGKLVSWVKVKFNKLVKKLGQIGGFDDPIDRWFWLGILGWGAAIFLSIIGSLFSLGFAGFFGLGTLIYLLGVLGTAAIVIWIIKKFA